MEHLRITIDGKTYDVVVEKITGSTVSTPAASVYTAPVAAAPRPAPQPVPAAAPAANHPVAEGDVPSPLAGLVQAIAVEEGTAVKAGDLVITLEAMKMYTPINAPCDGTVKTLHVKVGDAVEEGQALFTIT